MEAYVAAVLAGLADELGDAEPLETVLRGEYSNDVAEVRFADGRTLMVKRARFAWAGPRFMASRLASRLLRERAGVVAPAHLDLPPDLGGPPGLAYWRIPLPTLEQLWPELPEEARPDVLRGWGRLLRQVHRVRLPGHGPLPAAVQEATDLAEFLTRDLEDGLGPHVEQAWPDAAPIVRRLIAAIPEVAARARGEGSVLVHNDLWIANVLCEVEDGVVRCVGVLDLEDCFGGPAEADLAKVEVLHGPLFSQPLAGPWFERVWEGYAAPLDPLVLAFFRVYHLMHMGSHAAASGYAAHARDVVRTSEEWLDALDSADRRDTA